MLLDEMQAEKNGAWIASQNSDWARIGGGYVHDGNAGKGEASITFWPAVPKTGDYELVLVYPPHPNRATRVPVMIATQGSNSNAEEIRYINQRDAAKGNFASLGTFHLAKGAKTSITISNKDTNGYVVVDGLQLIPRS